MTVENTRKVVEGFLNAEHSEKFLAQNAVFATMFDGQEQKGSQAISEMMHHLYQVAFKADAEPRSLIFGEDQSVLEADFVGEHSAEFAGIPATGKHVRVPLCVVYDVEGEVIQRARIYFEISVLMEQLKGD